MATTKALLKKALVVVGAIATVASLGYSRITYLANRTLAAQNSQQAARLAELDGKVKALNHQHEDDLAQIKSLNGQVATLLPENTTLKDNMGAFAEQAGTCEKIRQTLKLGT